MIKRERHWNKESVWHEVSGLLPHLEHHDLSDVAVSRAPIEEIEVVRKRMGWEFCWVSSYKSDFNYDFHVSFRPDEVKAGKTIYNFRDKKIGPETYTLSGHSVFYTQRVKSFTLTAPSARAMNNSWESSHSMTYCRRSARSMDRHTRFRTGGRFTTGMRAMARTRRLADVRRPNVDRR